MTTALLDLEEVITLTGYRRPSKQRGWLDTQGIQYHVRYDGYPVVPRDALTTSSNPPEVEPDWAALPR